MSLVIPKSFFVFEMRIYTKDNSELNVPVNKIWTFEKPSIQALPVAFHC